MAAARHAAGRGTGPDGRARGAPCGRRGRGGSAYEPVRDTGGVARRLALAAQDTGAADVSGDRDGRLAFDRARPVPVDAPTDGGVAHGDESARPAGGARVWPQHAPAGAARRSAPGARRSFAHRHRSRWHRYRRGTHHRAQPAAAAGRKTYRAADGRQRDRWQRDGRIARAGRAGRAAIRRGAAAVVGGAGRDRRLSGAQSSARARQLRAQTRHPERSSRAGRDARAAEQQRRGVGPSHGRAPAGAQPFRPSLPTGSLRRLPAQRANRCRLTAGRRQPGR